MAACIKYCLLLLMSLSAMHRGYANEIDRLNTKEDVKKFLAANFREKGYFTGGCPEPVSSEKVKKEIENDTSVYHTDFGGRTVNFPTDFAAYALDNNDWHFYKADIDRNGYTDMVIDAGMVIVIMDMGGSIEGQIVSVTGQPVLYGFKQFITLPDGSPALVLRHDYNPEKSRAHSDRQGKVAYVTDTLTGNTGSHSIKVDTLYKITTGADSISKIAGTGQDRKRENVYNGEYADTVNMRLYNMTDTIVYKFNGFTTYKPGFKSAGISKIGYYYHDYGTVTGWVPANSCLEINKNGRCLLQYQYREVGAVFSAMLDSTALSRLWGFIGHIDILPVKECNSKVVMDGGEGATFAFYFDDGTVKKMDFWNCRPPMGLGYLGKAIAEISEALKWQLSEKNRDFNCPCVLPDSKYGEGDCKCGN